MPRDTLSMLSLVIRYAYAFAQPFDIFQYHAILRDFPITLRCAPMIAARH